MYADSIHSVIHMALWTCGCTACAAICPKDAIIMKEDNEGFLYPTVASIKSMQNFVDEPANTAKSLLRRSDFPKDLETLLTTAALIFNYYGRRSICLMYAQDYREDVDIMEFSEFIGTAQLAALDTFLKGWLNAAQIDVLGQFYFGMIGTKIKEYGLV